MSGVWAFGLVELVGARGELSAILVDEETEMLEVRVFAERARAKEIASLVSSMREHIGAPRKFVVPSRRVADALREAGIREEIEIGKSLALDDAMQALDETLKSGSPEKGEPPHESGEVARRSFHEAAEQLISIAPYSRFPEGATFEVHAPSIEIERGGVFLMGTDLESAGWVFAFSEDDIAGIPFLDGATEEPSSAMAMCMQPLEGELVPVLARSVRGAGIIPPSASDYELATALCRALTQLAENASDKVQVETAKGAAICVEGPIEGEQ